MTEPTSQIPAHEAAPSRPARARSRIGWLGMPVAVFLALAGLFAIALSTGDPTKLPSALIGKPAPAVTLPPLQGLTTPTGPARGFSTADLPKGEVALVNFWASWCAPCVQEHPLLVTLAKETGVRIYGINYKDQADKAVTFLQRLGNPYAAVGVDASGRAAIEWGVYGMPETFVVDGEGRIAYKHVGAIDAKALESRILPAIATARAAALAATKAGNAD